MEGIFWQLRLDSAICYLVNFWQCNGQTLIKKKMLFWVSKSLSVLIVSVYRTRIIDYVSDKRIFC